MQHDLFIYEWLFLKNVKNPLQSRADKRTYFAVWLIQK